MRIGLDIDNVIADFDKGLLKELKKEDKKKRNNGIINKNERYAALLFDWSTKEIRDFFENNMERIAKVLELRKDVKYYMDKLIEDGHELYLITNRVYPDYQNPKEVTINWLREKEINYKEIIFTETRDKSKACIDNKIDIMFDDDIGNCIRLKNKGINYCLMCTKLNYEHRGNLPYVRDFKELYEKVKNMNNKKKIILDTDMYNEVDDQFALTYLMNSLNNIELEAITIAPFSKSGYAEDLSIEDGLNRSIETTKKVLSLINREEYINKIYKGASKYSNEEQGDNDATDKIIEIAHKNDKTIIVGIGAITNIALAIKKDPTIIDKIEVFWLGGNSFLSHQNREFNFYQDIDGVRTVFNSKVKLTVIPCRNVASHLTTTKYELEHYIGNTKIGRYLIDTMINCKKGYYKEEKDSYGTSKTIWDLSAIAYLINEDWFVKEYVSCPNILNDGRYEMTKDKHEIIFINDLSRNKIFNDFFVKMKGENND